MTKLILVLALLFNALAAYGLLKAFPLWSALLMIFVGIAIVTLVYRCSAINDRFREHHRRWHHHG